MNKKENKYEDDDFIPILNLFQVFGIIIGIILLWKNEINLINFLINTIVIILTFEFMKFIIRDTIYNFDKNKKDEEKK